MRITPSDEQEEFRSVLRRFLEEHSPTTEVRRLMETEAGYDRGVWQKLSEELGLPGLHIPEKYGGQGFGYVELCIVMEEAGRALLCAPFLSSAVLAANAILEAASESQKARLLPAIASGKTLSTLAFTEADGLWSTSSVATTAKPEGDVFRLDGEKHYVVDGHIAELIVVVAREPDSAGEDDISLFVVDGRDEDVVCETLTTADSTRKLSRLRLSSVRAERLGEAGAGEAALKRTLDLAAIALASESVGAAQKVLEDSVAYAKTRVQFGRPIGSFQAIKHKCADMLLEVELARSAASYAAAAVAEDSEEVPALASLAKAFCSDVFFRAARDSIQIHGGIGFTWEQDMHLYFKRAKSSEVFLGDPTYHRELLAQRLAI